MASRQSVPEGTKRVLYILSRNRCAFPGCKELLVVPPTEKSSYKIIGEICHIHSPKESGPRGRVGLTDEEYNAHDNLIVLCPNHHTRVDGQHEAYPAQTLKEWKETHEAKPSRVSPQDLDAPPEVFYHSYFPTALVDQTIDEEVNLLRKSRFYVEFDGIGCTLTLSKRLSEGNLYGGTATVKAWALAWCARVLAGRGELDKVEEYLEIAESLGPGTEIARAFICSHRGDKSTALKLLAGVDSPNSRSAAFMIVGNHDGPQEAVDWLKATGLGVSDLDPDGKFILLKYQLELGQWEAARETTNTLSVSDLEGAPVLHYVMAMSYLLSTVPAEFRNVVLHQVPFEAANFPLASDSAAIDARRTAHSHFINAAEAARRLNCPNAASMSDRYALWLELSEPEHFDEGRLQLEDRLRGPNPALHLVSLGIQFGVELDPVAVEQEIERQTALHGDITQDAAVARFVLACTQETPEDAAIYVDRHYNTISKYLTKKMMRCFQIQMFSQAGLPERAKEYLELLLEEGLSEAEESRLRIVIAKSEGKDTIEVRKALFKQTDSLTDLMDLVDEFEERKKWDVLCKYGESLFERTRFVQHAERLAIALNNANKPDRVVELLEENAGFLAQSTKLQMFYCWALYYEGELLKARSELAKLSADPENVNYRALKVNIGIALEDWDSLSTFVTNEYRQMENRSAHELIKAAQLSQHLSIPYAKQFLFAATEKGNDDADVLATAYFLALKAGWEGDAIIGQWLEKAVELSGDDGPFQKITLNDVIDQKPEWDRQESETWQLLNRGEIHMIFAAQLLNKSLNDLMLFSSYASLSESDPRRRGGIPAYGGGRQPTPLDTGGTVGIDAAALLTLSFLNLLGTAFDAVDTVYVPHSTLAWLFEEKQQAAFHQPSRIRDAHHVRHLLATEVLEEFSPSTMVDRELSAQVGDDLAMLIAEAESSTDEDTQRFVVRSSPVYKVVSLREEEADLTGHAAVMSSCQAVVRKLRQKSQITAIGKQNALAYLQLHEKPWPHQPEITDGAMMYLDDLAVAYFLHLGILEKLRKAELRSFVSSRVISEFNALIAYERISGKVIDAIENIRSVVSLGIESGKIKVGRWRNVDEGEDQSISEHQIVGVLALAEDCDAVIADDRFFNQHPRIEHNGAQAPLFSTLDLLDALASAGSITPDDRLEYRTNLRRAGYLFVPVTEDELTNHLNTAAVTSDKLNETLELKAIRESILLVRMSDWLQLPREATWPDMTEKALVRALRALWRDDVDVSVVTARSNWIIDQLDIENGDNILKTGRGELILVLLVPPADAPQEIRAAYRKWAEERILTPFKEQYPDLFAWIVANYKTRISEFVDQEQIEGLDMADIPNGRALSAKAMLDLAPPLMRETLLDDGQFWDELGFKVARILTFEDSGVSFQRSELYDAFRQTLSGASNLTVTDTEGRKWVIGVKGEES